MKTIELYWTVLVFATVSVPAFANQASQATPFLIGQGDPNYFPLDAVGRDGVKDLLQGKLDVAEQEFRADLVDHPGEQIIQIWLAETLFDEGQDDEAMSIYQKLSASNVNGSPAFFDVKSFYRYAILLCKHEDWSDAVNIYHRAYSLTMMRHGDPEVKYLPAFDLSRPSYVSMMAAAYVAIGEEINSSNRRMYHEDQSQALPYYKKALDLMPDWDVAQFYYAFGLHEAGNDSDAQNAMTKVQNTASPQVATEASKQLLNWNSNH